MKTKGTKRNLGLSLTKYPMSFTLIYSPLSSQAYEDIGYRVST